MAANPAGSAVYQPIDVPFQLIEKDVNVPQFCYEVEINFAYVMELGTEIVLLFIISNLSPFSMSVNSQHVSAMVRLRVTQRCCFDCSV
jgi:hypothetical protein